MTEEAPRELISDIHLVTSTMMTDEPLTDSKLENIYNQLHLAGETNIVGQMHLLEKLLVKEGLIDYQTDTWANVSGADRSHTLHKAALLTWTHSGTHGKISLAEFAEFTENLIHAAEELCLDQDADDNAMTKTLSGKRRDILADEGHSSLAKGLTELTDEEEKAIVKAFRSLDPGHKGYVTIVGASKKPMVMQVLLMNLGEHPSTQVLKRMVAALECDSARIADNPEGNLSLEAFHTFVRVLQLKCRKHEHVSAQLHNPEIAQQIAQDKAARTHAHQVWQMIDVDKHDFVDISELRINPNIVKATGELLHAPASLSYEQLKQILKDAHSLIADIDDGHGLMDWDSYVVFLGEAQNMIEDVCS